MWQHSDVFRIDVHSLLIEPNGTEPYYTRSNECKISDEIYTPLLIEPSATEPSYTMSVWHVEECRHTQAICTPQLTLVLKSPTTPCLFDMWQNADIPRSDVPHPSLIDPSGTESYYTMSV